MVIGTGQGKRTVRIFRALRPADAEAADAELAVGAVGVDLTGHIFGVALAIGAFKALGAIGVDHTLGRSGLAISIEADEIGRAVGVDDAFRRLGLAGAIFANFADETILIRRTLIDLAELINAYRRRGAVGVVEAFGDGLTGIVEASLSRGTIAIGDASELRQTLSEFADLSGGTIGGHGALRWRNGQADSGDAV